MNEINLKNGESNWIKIEGGFNEHIKEVVVINGADDYVEKSRVRITDADVGQLLVVHQKPWAEPTPGRLRGEPCVMIRLETEECGDDKEYWLTINHHKGGVMMSFKITDPSII